MNLKSREERQRQYRQKHREKIAMIAKRWRSANPKKKYAHGVLNRAVKNGEIVKPSICQQCESEKPLVAHHHDYDRPLDVFWICRSCHAKEHGTYRGPKTTYSEESHPMVKLSREQVLEIRRLLAEGKHSKRGLGRMFGVDDSLIRQIERREIWKNL